MCSLPVAGDGMSADGGSTVTSRSPKRSADKARAIPPGGVKEVARADLDPNVCRGPVGGDVGCRVQHLRAVWPPGARMRQGTENRFSILGRHLRALSQRLWLRLSRRGGGQSALYGNDLASYPRPIGPRAGLRRSMNQNDQGQVSHPTPVDGQAPTEKRSLRQKLLAPVLLAVIGIGLFPPLRNLGPSSRQRPGSREGSRRDRQRGGGEEQQQDLSCRRAHRTRRRRNLVGDPGGPSHAEWLTWVSPLPVVISACLPE